MKREHWGNTLSTIFLACWIGLAMWYGLYRLGAWLITKWMEWL